ncbi:hypothetical protein TrLO_g6408 [Triparma laevis f. longispina]|uniref:Uncharacterized protein n=2 Tax=Triparma laevis TaxID=1534972 RepID=A0A9W6ZPL4_9STRA|nr:hypothetical protein TrLO_g6408 [Triparma laevis f. longispina]
MSSFITLFAEQITNEVVEHALERHDAKILRVSKRKLLNSSNVDNSAPSAATTIAAMAMKSPDPTPSNPNQKKSKSATTTLTASAPQSHPVSQYEVVGYGLEDRVSVLTSQLSGCTIDMKTLRNAAFSTIPSDLETPPSSLKTSPKTSPKKKNNAYVIHRQKQAKRLMFKSQNLTTLLLLLLTLFFTPLSSLTLPTLRTRPPLTKALTIPIDVVLPRLTRSLISSSIHTTLTLFYPTLLSSDTEWLFKKVEAVSPVLRREMFYVDLCILTRLIVEEQVLDRNKSIKCNGKYGSIYHPSEPINIEGDNKNGRGGRPLTVGELVENFNDMREVLVGRWGVDEKVVEEIEEMGRVWDDEKINELINTSITLKCVSTCSSYIYVHIPSDMLVPEKIVTSVATQCDVVEGGTLADAVEYMLKDVEEIEKEEEGNGQVAFMCVSRDVSELEDCVKDERSFPAKFLFVCNNRLEREKNKGIDNPFISSLDQRSLQKLIKGEEREYSVGLVP